MRTKGPHRAYSDDERKLKIWKGVLVLCDCFESAKNAYCSIPIPGIDTPCGDSSDMDLVYRPVTKLPANPMVTMAYVPFQEDVTEYDSEKALMKGTAFPDLDKPFYGKAGCHR